MPDGTTSDQPLLILCVPSPADIPGAQELLGPSSAAVAIESIEDVSAKVQEHGDARLAILCPEPEAWIAIKLAAGDLPSDAVKSWRKEVQPILAAKRARRRLTTLIFGSFLGSSPAACANALGLPVPDSVLSMPRAADPVLVMIAREALRRDPTSQSAAEELIASALGVNDFDKGSSLQADEIFSAYSAKLDRLSSAETARNEVELLNAAERSRALALEAALTKAENQSRTLKQEISLLKDQIKLDATSASNLITASAKDHEKIKLALAEHEKSKSVISKLTNEIALLHDQIKLGNTASDEVRNSITAEQTKAKSSETTLVKTRAVLKEAEKELSLLREQIRLDRTAVEQLQTALDAERTRSAAQAVSAKTTKTALEARLSEAEKAAANAQAKAEADLGQLIQQLREQVRHMSQGLENYHTQVEGLEAERTDLIGRVGQLHRGQEDLEGYYDQARKLTDQVASMGEELTSLRGLLEERDSYLAQLEAEISKIHSSRSYRLMTPLRKIRQAID